MHVNNVKINLRVSADLECVFEQAVVQSSSTDTCWDLQKLAFNQECVSPCPDVTETTRCFRVKLLAHALYLQMPYPESQICVKLYNIWWTKS